LAEIVIDNITKFKENVHPNSNHFEVSYFIDLAELHDDSKVIADNIANIISEADEYN
jgi:hypothetical protein